MLMITISLKLTIIVNIILLEESSHHLLKGIVLVGVICKLDAIIICHDVLLLVCEGARYLENHLKHIVMIHIYILRVLGNIKYQEFNVSVHVITLH